MSVAAFGAPPVNLMVNGSATFGSPERSRAQVGIYDHDALFAHRDRLEHRADIVGDAVRGERGCAVSCEGLSSPGHGAPSLSQRAMNAAALSRSALVMSRP